MPDFLNELKWRGLFYQCTDEAALAQHLQTGVRRGYVGYDPTADSLTIGNMVTIMLLAHLQRAGHTPVVVSGGGTGLIGDPSGKSAERQLQTEEIVRHNVERQRGIFSKLLDFSPTLSNRAVIVNNLDWLGKLTYIEALRDIGKHFSVNMMIQKDSVRERLHARDQGISYTEFSYMILQSYDYWHLYKAWQDHGGLAGPVTLQMGGSDQWGNIVAGADLIRRQQVVASEEGGLQRGTAQHIAFGLTCPLITKADGGKFGKTESGAVWMTAERTSPFAFYQFWLNASDEDIPKFLKIFTFLSQPEIEALIAAHAANPGAREAHRALARHATELLHGPTEVANAESAAKALFSGEVANLSEPTLREVLANVPSSTHSKNTLSAGIPILDFLVTTQLAQSKREAKEFLATGSVTINGRKVGADDKLTTADLLHGTMIALRRGKKNWHLTRWE